MSLRAGPMGCPGTAAPHKAAGVQGAGSSLLRGRTAQRVGGSSSIRPVRQVQALRDASQDQPLDDSDTCISPAAAAAAPVPLAGRIPITGRGAGPRVLCMSSADSGLGGAFVSVVDPPSPQPQRQPQAQPQAQPQQQPLAAGGSGLDSEAEAAADVDSRQYVREVINLSVELDPEEENMHKSQDSMDEYTTGLESPPPQEQEEEVTTTEARRLAGEMSADRMAARELLRSFNAAEYVGDRHNWMIITAPETLVAGEEAIILFNRQQSEALRARPRIQLQYAFNAWSLNDNGNNLVADMSPAPMNKDFSDFWWTRIQVPDMAYELNFVLSDCEGLYENNLMQDFMFPAIEGATVAEWALMEAERLRKMEEEHLVEERKKAEEERRVRLLKLEEDKRAKEEAERRHQEELRQQDAVKAAQKAEALVKSYVDNQAKSMLKLRTGPNQDDLSAPLVWTASPAPRAGAKTKIYYNRRATNLNRLNLNQDQHLTLRWGVNWWKSPLVVELKRSAQPPSDALAVPAPAPPPAPSTPATPATAGATPAAAAAQASPAPAPAPAPTPAPEAEWWETEIDIPSEATIVNFVVNFHNDYDNNGTKDYAIKVSLPEGQTLESWSAALTETFRVQEFETRVAAEAEARQREMRRNEKRKQAQEQVMAVERRKVRHVLFTEPEIIQAGEEVTIWYNPADTVLVGKQQVFLQCGFNRWSHASPVGPLPMLPPDVLPQYDEFGNEVTPYLTRSGSPTHFKATFVVPHDAYKMDFVFSDVAGGDGVYDNRGGYDYHLPVSGSPKKEDSLYVVHIAVEMAPIAKVGGLGDVVTALGRAVQDQGHQVEVMIPKYEFFNWAPLLNGQMRFETEYDWGGTRIAVSTATVENLRVWFIEPRNGFFQTPSVYGRYDDEVRFDFFCKAALEFLLRTNRQPDILHCHDWSTAHVAKAYWEDYNPYGLWKPKVIFTIHNLNYGQKKLSEAASYCQKFTTVSPTYAFETGGTPIIEPHVGKFCGIRNGIDPEIWDPEHNPFLPAPITPEAVHEGKAAARTELRKRANLSSWNDKLVVAVVSRLTPQKGVHLIKHTAHRCIDRGAQFVLLGSAPDPKLQAEFDELAASMGGQDASFLFKYDEPLSHLIYAGADIIVVPSMFEPCGLTQMIAMRYGTVPVVRHTGGLKDTVFDVDFDKARAAWELYGSSDWEKDGIDATNGFAFEGVDTDALDYALNRAIDAYYNDREWFRSLQLRVMEQDWTWNRPGLDYIELYFAAIKQ